MKAYLAGPMRGYPAFNFPAFMDAAERLTLAGLEVFNPAGQDTDAGYDFSACDGTEDLASMGFDLRDALAADLSFITLNAEALVALPGWEGSLGATAEVHAALALGLLVWEYDADATLSLVDWLHESIEQAQKAAEPVPGPQWVEYGGARYLAPPAKFAKSGREEALSRAGGWQNIGYTTDEPGAEPFTRPEPDPEQEAALEEARKTGAYPGCTCEECENSREARVEAEPEPQACETCGHYSDHDYGGTHLCRYRGCVCDDPTASPTGEVRTTSLTGGEKGDKPARYDLIPAGPLWALAELYGAGARKYADRNWERGYAWHLSFAAMQRHAWLFWQGENVDPETGAPHLASVVFHAFALMEWEVTHPEYDDRPSTEKE